jgi:V/A-type H+-transporting ATPase subunit A
VLLPQIIAVKSKGELPQIKFTRDYKPALAKIMADMEAEFKAMRAG